MDVDAFWSLIERSRQEAGDPDARLEWLQRQLARQPAAEIVDFQVWLDRARRRADTWDMWGAAYLLCDSLCSGDGFFYFQVWLIGLGRDAFEQAVADPDNLAGLPEVVRLAGRPVDDRSRGEWPDWEALGGVAWAAYEQVTGEEEGIHAAMEARGHHSPHDPDPAGEPWDFEDAAEAARRLPRLSWMSPLPTGPRGTSANVRPSSACSPNGGRLRRSSSRSSWAAVLAPKIPRTRPDRAAQSARPRPPAMSGTLVSAPCLGFAGIQVVGGAYWSAAPWRDRGDRRRVGRLGSARLVPRWACPLRTC
jgi:hypothetical protein